METNLTYMDCWHFISYILPTNSKTSREIYCMVYHALKEAEERRIAEKRKLKRLEEAERGGGNAQTAQNLP